MATTSTNITCNIHGATANTGAFPYIDVSFTITFTRTAGSKTVNWSISNMDKDDDGHGTGGTFAYQLAILIAVNPADPSNPNYNDEMYYILEKDNGTVGSGWWDHLQVYNPSGSFQSTGSSATIYFYAMVRGDDFECCFHDNNTVICYVADATDERGTTYDLFDDFTVDIPEYENKYTVTYDANGGMGAPKSQEKSSVSDLILSDVIPTKNLSLDYYNNPDGTLSNHLTMPCTFLGWRCYHKLQTTATYSQLVTSPTTTFPENGFDPVATSIRRVITSNQWISPSDYDFINNQIVFHTPITSGTVRIDYNTASGYSEPEMDPSDPTKYRLYPAGGIYSTNAKAYMVAEWGSASFTSLAIPDKYYTVTFNYNGGTGTPPSLNCLSEEVGYATTPGGAKVYNQQQLYNEGIFTSLSLYPIYGDAVLTQLPQPTREGFNFLGWYTDSSFTGDPITVPYTVTSNITLYAKWGALLLHIMDRDGTWHPLGPYVWKFVEEDGVRKWKKIAHVYKLVEEDGVRKWKDVSS